MNTKSAVKRSSFIRAEIIKKRPLGTGGAASRRKAFAGAGPK
jgi:hypothetical protein